MQIDQPRLLIGAPEALTISAHWHHRQGWQLSISVRHQAQTWAEADRRRFGDLSTPELLQALDGSLERLLGL